jgi:hypothetical protein
MTRADFAKVCGVSRAAVTQAARRGQVTDKGGEIDIRDPLNRAYLMRLLLKMKGDKIPAGWTVLYADRGSKECVPLCWFPPDADEFFGGEPDETGQRIRTDDGWLIDIAAAGVTDPAGTVFPVRIVTVGDADPRWLTDGYWKGRNGKRARHG